MSSTLTRRQWLRLAAGTIAGLGVAGRLYAAPPNSPRFLLVFLPLSACLSVPLILARKVSGAAAASRGLLRWRTRRSAAAGG